MIPMFGVCRGFSRNSFDYIALSNFTSSEYHYGIIYSKDDIFLFGSIVVRPTLLHNEMLFLDFLLYCSIQKPVCLIIEELQS